MMTQSLRTNLLLSALLAAAPASLTVRAAGPAAPPAHAGAIGSVDPEPFLGLVDEDDIKVEINLRGNLLKTIATALREEDARIGRMISGLSSVSAAVLEIRRSRLEAARRLMKATTLRLESDGWETLARVRDDGDNIVVLTHSNPDAKQIEGLVVLALTDEHVDIDTLIADDDSPEPSAGRHSRSPKVPALDPPTHELIFANIAGPLQLADIKTIGAALELPGLDQIPTRGK